MASRSQVYRNKLKESNPEAYEEYLAKQRERGQRLRDERKRQREEEPQTRAQVEMYEAKRKKKSEQSKANYYRRKAEKERQTRSSSSKTPDQPQTPQPKRPRDMNEEERRAYNAAKRKRQRDMRSSQKKTADKLRRRREYKAMKEKEVKALLVQQPKQAPSAKKLPQKAYNLNHEYKTKTKKIGLTDAKYAQTAMNLLLPRTPEKRAAIAALQENHPCRVLFSEPEPVPNMEEELGINLDDEIGDLGAEEVQCSNTLHDTIQLYYLHDDISRILPHSRYSTKNGAARVMLMTIKDAFSKFKEANPTIQVGLTLFQQQRPKNVRLLGSVPVESCLCVYCTNVRLKINSLNRLLGTSGRLPSEGKLLNFINCPINPNKTRWNAMACIDGECDRCQDRMRGLMVFCRDILYIDEVSCVQWMRGESGMAMGMCHKPGSTDYWDTTFWINRTDGYGKVMSRNRYQLIMGFLHFNDNRNRIERGNEGYNPLFKIQPLLDIVLPSFMEYFQPGRELSIDESMVRFKGRVAMKQYLPAKPTKWGFKIFVLADAASHYCLRAKVYTGKEETRDPNISFSGQIVKELLQGFEEKGHIIFTDSYYTSPLLYKDLKSVGVGACGTVIDNRKQFPDQLKAKNLKIKKGDAPVFFATEDNKMLAVSWFVSKRVNLISTVDGNGTFQKTVRQRGRPEGRRIEKPNLVENYNKHMGAVDHFDQVSLSYPYPHRSYKWYFPLYHFLMETAVVNAYILYKASSPENKLSSKKFRHSVCMRLVERQTLRRKSLTNTPTFPTARLDERHFMDKYTKPRYKPCCVVCKAAGKRAQTCMYCPDCNVPLCQIPCFKLYHTIDNYAIIRRRQLQPQQTSPGTPGSSTSS